MNIFRLLSITIFTTVFSSLSANDKIFSDNKIVLPDSILIVDGDNNRSALKVTGNTVQSGDISVSMEQKIGGLTFFLTSPVKSVKQIQAVWCIARNNECLYLGDHWERSYGDLQWLKADSQHGSFI